MMRESTKDNLKTAVFESKLNIMDDIIERTLCNIHMVYVGNTSSIISDAIDELKEVIKSVEIDLENIENRKTTVTEWWSKD